MSLATKLRTKLYCVWSCEVLFALVIAKSIAVNSLLIEGFNLRYRTFVDLFKVKINVCLNCACNRITCVLEVEKKGTGVR